MLKECDRVLTYSVPISLVTTGVGTTLPAGIAPDGDARKVREARRERAPDPEAQILEAGLVEALDFVQHAMVEVLAHREAGGFHVAQVRDEAGLPVGTAFQRDFHLEGVAVDASIQVPLGKIIEMVRGVEAESVRNFHGASSECR